MQEIRYEFVMNYDKYYELLYAIEYEMSWEL